MLVSDEHYVLPSIRPSVRRHISKTACYANMACCGTMVEGDIALAQSKAHTTDQRCAWEWDSFDYLEKNFVH